MSRFTSRARKKAISFHGTENLSRDSFSPECRVAQKVIVEHSQYLSYILLALYLQQS